MSVKAVTNRAILHNGTQYGPGMEVIGYTDPLLQAWLRANPPSVRVEDDAYEQPVEEEKSKAIQATDVGAYGIPEGGAGDEDKKVGKPPARGRRKK